MNRQYLPLLANDTIPYIGDWKNQVYVEMAVIAKMFLVSMKNEIAPSVKLLTRTYNAIMNDLARAATTDSFIRAIDRSSLLIPIGELARNGKRVFMLCVRNLIGRQPYCITKNKGCFLTEDSVDWRLYQNSGKYLAMNGDNIVNFDQIEQLEIGHHHILEGKPRVTKVMCWNGLNSSEKRSALELCINNSLHYAREHRSVVYPIVHQGGMEVVIPFMDENKRILNNLAVVVKYDKASKKISIPTVLWSRMVVVDSKLSSEPLPPWLKAGGSAM